MDDMSRDVPTLYGRLNVYTMETGDGREIELSVVGDYICWRRVNDREWVKLAPLSALTPKKGKDYWSDEDKREILDYVESKVGGNVPHERLLGRNQPDQHSIDSITNLRSELDNKLSRVVEPVSREILTVNTTGDITCSGIKLSDLMKTEEIRSNYATKKRIR